MNTKLSNQAVRGKMTGMKAVVKLFFVSSALLLLSACISRRDALEPVITIYKPPSGSVQGAGVPTVEGYVMDDEGIVSLKVGSTEFFDIGIYANDRGKRLVQFAFNPVDSGEGVFAETIVARDRSGRETVFPYELRIDITPPTVELREVQNLSGDRLRVVGVARDNDAVKSITVSGRAVEFIASPEQEFSVDVDRSENMTVEVRDQADNVTSQPLE